MNLRSLSLLLSLLALSGCVHRVVTLPPDAKGLPGEPPPEGMVEVNVVSEEPEREWAVVVGNETLCTTPCRHKVSASAALLLRSRGGDEALVPDLAAEAPPSRRLMLVAEGTQGGKRVNGIVFTSLGGMGVITAITLVAAGCSDVQARGGVCTGGLITAGVSVPLTAVALWMLLDSGPRAHLLPVAQVEPGHGQPPVTVALLPGGLAGSF